MKKNEIKPGTVSLSLKKNEFWEILSFGFNIRP